MEGVRISELPRARPSTLRAARTMLEAVVFGVLPALLVAGGLLYVAGASDAMEDWGFLRSAADRILDGQSPYVDPAQLGGSGGFAYPPLSALLLMPIVALPDTSGQVAYYLLAAACIPAALFLLGVRDWRCYGLALVGSPVTACLKLGTLGPFLLLAVAVAWRLRERRFAAGVALGLTVALKPFTWPLLAWGILRGRVAGTIAAVASAVAVCLVSWAVIGFAGFTEYGETLRQASRIWAPQSFSLVALGVSVDVPRSVATLVALCAAVAVMAVAWRYARRGGERDAVTLTACIAAALIATPILWEHYLILLLAPIALAAPRLSPLWVVPVALEAVRLPAWSNGEARKIVPLLATVALVVAWSLVDLRRRARPV